MKIVKKIAIALLIVLVGMQFLRPEKNISEGDYVTAFENEAKPSQEVKKILKTACYDCHSANTEYPWYNNIAPVSYWLADHIEDGKKHLDFSSWTSYDTKKKDHKLEELIEEVKEGNMPLNEYTWTHSDAKLTEDEVSVLVAWAEQTRANY
ncbi:heme-binding domain-containing protein [Allomuricauda sp. F6463D]|uniref:heme-binding domain-containing protein n=1 Tax=Allomuricauda sp. F6463D TaxID=2926409 RepID=UPI001FF3E7FF|nr:heme-binding domain-containing protein [Muricauda sp. F6463D]MCK0162196.1 heme-binding domain-containing protein [Muricauda sp. F6463D]